MSGVLVAMAISALLLMTRNIMQAKGKMTVQA